MGDSRTRRDRRSDPDRWYRVAAYFDPDEQRMVEVEGHGAVCIKGSIEDVIVVQIPDLTPQQQLTLLKGFQATIQGAGIEKPVVLIPAWVKVVKFRPIDAATGKKLDRHARRKPFTEH